MQEAQFLEVEVKERRKAMQTTQPSSDIEVIRGFCAGCKGSRDDKALDEPILLCDGRSCTREYHLSCTGLKRVPDGNFFCSHCALQIYFDTCDEARAEFKSRREFVEALLRTYLLAGKEECEKTISEMNDDSEKRKESNYFRTDSKLTNNHNKEWKQMRKIISLGIPPICINSVMRKNEKNIESEIGRFDQLCGAVFDDSKWYIAATDEAVKINKMSPKFFIGKTIRLYSPIENMYRVGRIINYRTAFPNVSSDFSVKINSKDKQERQDLFFGKGAIATLEYLVRFVSNPNGRRKTVCYWIVFEEHCCAINAMIIIAQKDKSKGIVGWEPAQLALRSSLELSSSPEERIISQSNWIGGLVSFFGEGCNKYLDLEKETVSFFSNNFQKHREMELNTKSRQGSYVHSSNMDLLMSIAKLEDEEQRRCRWWQTLPLKNYGHPKALSLADESFESLNSEYHKQQLKSNIDLAVSNGENKEVSIKPITQSLIHNGLDRIWLLNQMDSIDNPIEKSLDTAASFTFNFVSSPPLALSRLQEQREIEEI